MSVYSDLIIADGAQDYYRCDDVSGDLTNAIALRPEATAAGAVTYGETSHCSRLISAVGFPGASTDYFSNSATQDWVEVEHSWEFLIYCTDLSHRNMFLSHGELGTDVSLRFEMQVDTAGAILLSANNSSNAETAAGVITTNTWYHCIATYDDGLTNKGKWYVNGVLQTPLNTELTHTLTDTAQRLVIGRDSFSGTSHFHGRLDELSRFDFTMDQTMVTAHYEALCEVVSGTDDSWQVF